MLPYVFQKYFKTLCGKSEILECQIPDGGQKGQMEEALGAEKELSLF
jgi:hypothetical protein